MRRGLRRMSCSSAIVLISSAYSSSIFCRSRPTSVRSRMSTIACACTSLRLEALRQALFGLVGRLAAANDLDDFVDVVERDAVAFEQVRALFGLAQIVGASAA